MPKMPAASGINFHPGVIMSWNILSPSSYNLMVTVSQDYLVVCVHPIWPFGKSWAFVSPPWADVCHFL